MKMFTRPVLCNFLLLACVFTSFGNCVTYSIPTITITSHSSDTICTAGTTSTFTATINNGGTSPVYQWVVNGAYVGTNSSSYTAGLNNNDAVWCILTSNLACSVPGPAYSNQIRITVDAAGAANITPVTDCLGSPLSINGSASAASIIWQVAGAGIDTAIAIHAYYNSIIRAGGNGLGSALNQLEPEGIWVDSAGTVYVSDAQNNRILRFSAGSTTASSGVVVAGGNGAGSGANQLNNPAGVYVDKAGNLYVADYGNSRVQRFAAGSTTATNGVTVAGGAGYTGNSAGQLRGPVAVQKDDSGYIYILDKTNNVIAQYPPNAVPSSTANYVSGSFLQGQLPVYNGMWISGNGTIYASDINNQQILEFPSFDLAVIVGQIQWTLAGGNGAGAAANQLSNPASICLDNFGNLFVADIGNNRIQKFVLNNVQTVSGTTVVPNTGPSSIRLDGKGDIYTSETPALDVREYINASGIDTEYLPQAPGTYKAVVTTAGNCRTLTTGTVTVLPNATSVVNAVSCFGVPYHVGSYSHSAAGTYTDTLFNAASTGCDSIVTLHLQIDDNVVNTPQIYQNGDSLTAYILNNPAENYTWTFNGQSFAGDTGATINIHLNGEYMVTGTDSNSCAITPDSISVTGLLGIQTISNPTFGVQPNPSNGRFVLSTQQANGAKYVICNVLGQQIAEGVVTTNTQTITLSPATPGVYTLQLKYNNTQTLLPVTFVVTR